MSELTEKLEQALMPMHPNDRIRFADMSWGIQCHADRLAPLHAALLKCVEALEFECGGRCAPQNPCNAADVLADLRKALEECK